MSKSKSEAARINGAKSRGPVTPAGRARSSANSRTHGLTARYVFLRHESPPDFHLLLDDHINQFHPATPVEMELVETMVIACWRLRRLLAIESHLLDIETVRQREDIDEEFDNLPDPARLAAAFQTLGDQGHSIALVIRYEGSLNRSYDKAFKRLQQLQADRQAPAPPALEKKASNKKVRNEPTVDPGPVLDESPRLRDSGSRERIDAGVSATGNGSQSAGSASQKSPFHPPNPGLDVNQTIPVRHSVC